MGAAARLRRRLWCPGKDVMPVRVLAPAKINWTLEVLGRRPDGYHEVVTVLQTIALWDEVELEEAPGLDLETVGGPSFGEEDLALRAARLLLPEGGVRLRLRKGIPVSAGLGGGSSDAAAVLRGICSLLGLPMCTEELARLAASLGSDVPFFLHGGTALATGRGEVVSPLPDAPLVWLVLLVPPLGVEGKTGRMYRSLSPSHYSDGSFTRSFLARLEERGAVDEGLMHNAFEQVAYALLPDLAHYRGALLRAGARRVHLAGSGPALFALAADAAEAEALAGRLRAEGLAPFVARTVTRSEALGS
ncbi:MAG TPA: 4-(cytidine 5'-diphospho)-2-C-methyl-D-erythritol kinase [Dehalococcoidia bacterium]|nr:4-(cytidine 5'-diphospho)-2-C-methyl-D-erythritol kinase [Dehalococcoidia bacterium]